MAKPPTSKGPPGSGASPAAAGGKPASVRPRPPRPEADAPRRGGVRDVGSLLPQVGGTAFRKFGFLHSALLGRWRDVVGPVYARWSVPESLRMPRGKKSGGTLTIRVEGPFSLQLQQVAPQIMERANRIIGHNAVARIRLVQGDVPRPAVREAATPQAAPASGASPVSNLGDVGDERLRAALEELAAQLATKPGPSRIG